MTKILPPTYFIVYLTGEILLHFLFPLKQVVSTPYSYFGIILVVIGAILNLWADGQLKKGKTTVKPFEKPSILITDGAFCISRHPIYLGFVLILMGVAILLGSLISLAAPILMLITLETKFIPKEEQNLEEVFGREYLDYKNCVRQWL